MSRFSWLSLVVCCVWFGRQRAWANEEGVSTDYESEDSESQGGLDDVMTEPLTVKQASTIHSKADADADGKLSLEELMRFSGDMKESIAKKGVEDSVQMMDINGDGALSLDEILGPVAPDDGEEPGSDQDEDAMRRDETERFKAADTNGDGNLQLNEMRGFFYPETDPETMTLAAASNMESKDTDLDGKLTLKEFWEGDLPHPSAGGITDEEKEDFRKLDRNGDGYIDLEELKIFEAGAIDTEKMLKSLIHLVDKDGDNHISYSELSANTKTIAGSEAQHTLMEWALHNDEL